MVRSKIGEVILERFERFKGDFDDKSCEGHSFQIYFCDDTDPYYMGYCIKCGHNLPDFPVRMIDEVFSK